MPDVDLSTKMQLSIIHHSSQRLSIFDHIVKETV